jgi:hypothetical protein
MSGIKKQSKASQTCTESLPELEAKLRARLRARVVAMCDAANDVLDARKTAEPETPYGKAANE